MQHKMHKKQFKNLPKTFSHHFTRLDYLWLMWCHNLCCGFWLRTLVPHLVHLVEMNKWCSWFLSEQWKNMSIIWCSCGSPIFCQMPGWLVFDLMSVFQVFTMHMQRPCVKQTFSHTHYFCHCDITLWCAALSAENVTNSSSKCSARWSAKDSTEHSAKSRSKHCVKSSAKTAHNAAQKAEQNAR